MDAAFGGSETGWHSEDSISSFSARADMFFTATPYSYLSKGKNPYWFIANQMLINASAVLAISRLYSICRRPHDKFTISKSPVKNEVYCREICIIYLSPRLRGARGRRDRWSLGWEYLGYARGSFVIHTWTKHTWKIFGSRGPVRQEAEQQWHGQWSKVTVWRKFTGVCSSLDWALSGIWTMRCAHCERWSGASHVVAICCVFWLCCLR